MPQKQNKAKFIIFSLLKSLLFAFLLTIVFGFVLGYRPILVNGWSAEPDIHYQSLIIINQKVKATDLKVGDYITFSMTGKSYITHRIISIDLETDTIVCADNRYNSNTGEIEDGGTQTFSSDKVVGKVVFSNYILGNTPFSIRQNPWILFGIIGAIMLLLIMREQTKVEPTY